MSEMADTTHQVMGTHTEEAHHAPGLPQLDPTAFSSQLFWLTVTFVVLYLLVARSILPRIHDVMEKRQHHIQQDIDRAETLSQEAEDAREGYEKLQADARSKAQHVIAEAQAVITSMQEKQFAEVDADIAKKLNKARDSIASSRAEFKSKLTPVAQELASLAVEKIIGARPSEKEVEKSVLVEQE